MDGKQVMDRARREDGGFLTELDVAAIAADPGTRLQLLLVRCGNGRFLAPAQDVKHFVAVVEQHAATRRPQDEPGDYVRDVSLPANPERLPRVQGCSVHPVDVPGCPECAKAVKR